MKISVTRALSEIGMLEKRINKETTSNSFISFVIGQKPVMGYNSREEYDKKAKANYQSVMDLINRRDAIKKAVVASNAKTKVKIGKQTMTVAEAIEKKNSIQFKKLLLMELQKQLNSARNFVENENFHVRERLDRMVEASLGKEGKNKGDEYEAIAKPFLERNEAKLADPLNLEKKIEELSNEIDEFENEVDFILSESNTKTKIEVPE